MPRCYIISSILKQYDINIAWLISGAFRQFVVQQSGTNPDHKKVLGFHSLVTSLCSAKRIQINPFATIRPSIDNKFIYKNCTKNDQQKTQSHKDEERNQEPTVQPTTKLQSSHLTDNIIIIYMQHLESHIIHVQQQ